MLCRADARLPGGQAAPAPGSRGEPPPPRRLPRQVCPQPPSTCAQCAASSHRLPGASLTSAHAAGATEICFYAFSSTRAPCHPRTHAHAPDYTPGFVTADGMYRVRRVNHGSVVVACLEDVQPGDGVVFDTGAEQDVEPGGAVVRAVPQRAQHARHTGADAAAREVELTVRGLDPAAVEVGQLCWRTKRGGALAAARGTYDRTREVDKRRVPVDAVLSGRIGGPVTLTLRVRCALGLLCWRMNPQCLSPLLQGRLVLGVLPWGSHACRCPLQNSCMYACGPLRPPRVQPAAPVGDTQRRASP